MNPSATVAVPSWLPPPTAIAMTGGTFSFTPVAGATVHGAELQTMDGQRRWSITIFDSTTSFTLPGLSPDPLPLGTIRFAVSALRIPGVDLKNVVFDDLRDVLTDISTRRDHLLALSPRSSSSSSATPLVQPKPISLLV